MLGSSVLGQHVSGVHFGKMCVDKEDVTILQPGLVE